MLKKLRFGLLATSFLASALSAQASQTLIEPAAPLDTHLEVRAGYDKGSGATKLVLVLFDTKNNKIVRILDQKSTLHQIQKAIDESENTEVPEAMINIGANIAKDQACEADKQNNIDAISGVATAWARVAKNTVDYLKAIEDSSGVDIQKIPQSTEGLFGYLAAINHDTTPFLHDADIDLAIWDIGGGSMQITRRLPSNTQNINKIKHGDQFYEIYGGTTASATFMRQVLEKVRGLQDGSPNPLSSEDVQRAQELAITEANRGISQPLKDALKKSSTRVVAIGNVHKFSAWAPVESVLGERNKDEQGRLYYTADQLDRIIKTLTGKTDTEIKELMHLPKASFAVTQLTNMILIRGYMKALGIKTVYLTKANSGMGIFYDETHWDADSREDAKKIDHICLPPKG